MLVRDLSIPLLDPPRWNRAVCALSLVGAPQLLLYRFGSMTAPIFGGNFPIWAFVLVCSSPIAGAVYGCMRKSTPPGPGALQVCLLGLAFVSSSIWIDILASELVGGLEFMGISIGISRTIIGLTVLAWGNSIGDFVADTALARAGNPRMGAACCFGGPLFNMLIGTGVSLVYATMSRAEGAICLPFDKEVPLGFLFLIGSSLISLISVPYMRFWLSKKWGGVLISYYFLFLLCSLLLAVADLPYFVKWLAGWFGNSPDCPAPG